MSDDNEREWEKDGMKEETRRKMVYLKNWREEWKGRKGKGERKDENCKKQEMESKVRGRERNVKRKWTEKTSRMDDQLNQVKKIIKV